MKKFLILCFALLLLCGCSSKGVSVTCSLEYNGLLSEVQFSADKKDSVVEEFTMITHVSYEELGIDKDDEDLKSVAESVYKETPTEFGVAEVSWDDRGLVIKNKVQTSYLYDAPVTFEEMLRDLVAEDFECK